MATELKAYRARRIEAFLWIFGMGGLLLLGMVQHIFVVLDICNPLNFQPPEYEPGSVACYLEIIASTVILVIPLFFFGMQAWLRCTSVMIYSEHIEVTEWYGRRRSFPIQSPIKVQRGVSVRFPGGHSVKVPFGANDIYRLEVGPHKTYVNLRRFEDRAAEARNLTDFLYQLVADNLAAQSDLFRD